MMMAEIKALMLRIHAEMMLGVCRTMPLVASRLIGLLIQLLMQATTC